MTDDMVSKKYDNIEDFRYDLKNNATYEEVVACCNSSVTSHPVWRAAAEAERARRDHRPDRASVLISKASIWAAAAASVTALGVFLQLLL